MGFEVLMYMAILSPILPILVFVFRIKKYRVYGLYLLLVSIALTSELTCEFTKRITHNCNPIYNMHTLAGGLILSRIYYLIIKRKIVKRIIVLVAATLVFVAVYGFFISPGYLIYNSISSLLLNLLGLICSLAYFWELLTDLLIENIYNDPNFWISSAVLIFYGVNVTITAFDAYIVDPDMVLFYMVWPINLVAIILYNVMLSVGYWKLRKT